MFETQGFLRDYTLAVLSYWWALVPSFLLALLGLVSRLWHKELKVSRWVVLTVLAVGLIFAQSQVYYELWQQQYWLKPGVLRALISLGDKGELLFQAGLQSCKQKSSEGETEAAIEKWEEEVTLYLSDQRIGDREVALFQSDTGWNVSGRIFIECSGENFPLLLSRLQYKIEILKRIWSRKTD